jgi:hypothetical protein
MGAGRYANILYGGMSQYRSGWSRTRVYTTASHDLSRRSSRDLSLVDIEFAVQQRASAIHHDWIRSVRFLQVRPDGLKILSPTRTLHYPLLRNRTLSKRRRRSQTIQHNGANHRAELSTLALVER